MATKFVIDISDWQESLDFDEVIKAGVDGVIIKISEGTMYTDNLWHFVDACKEYNLPMGFYCYSHATMVEEAIDEAMEVAYLLSTLDIEDSDIKLGIWYDVEAPEMFESGVDTTAICSAFICTLNNLKYTNVGIYTSSLKCTDYTVNSIRPYLLDDYVPFWIADYRCFNEFVHTYPSKHCSGWQYDPHGNIGGVEVDLNEWYDEF